MATRTKTLQPTEAATPAPARLPETEMETEPGMEPETETETETETQPGESNLEPGLKALETPETELPEAEDVEQTDEAKPEGSDALPGLASTPLKPMPRMLSRQDAIAQLNASSHDLVTLLEPLLTASPVTQKKLSVVLASLGFSDTEVTEWWSAVRRLLETKKQAAQCLIRSLITEL